MLQPSAKQHRVLLGDFELVFSWDGDRWSHRIHLPDGAGRLAWRSVEGPGPPQGDPCWPSSPVVAELSEVPSSAAVVGVGRAGRSHFAVTFTALPPPSSGTEHAGPRLIVECACRIHGPPGWIGSTYERLEPGERHGGLIRLPADPPFPSDAPLPRTVTWSYVVGPDGPTGRSSGR